MQSLNAVSKSNRIEWIDTAKGIGILLVILGHLPGLGLIESIIYSFHVPLFFFLSGYVFKNTDPFPAFLKKKAKAILIPYVTLAAGVLIYNAVFSIINGNFAISSVLKQVLRFAVQRRYTSLWFLSCLFFLNLLFYAVSKIPKKWIRLVICVALPIIGYCYYLFLAPHLPWNAAANLPGVGQIQSDPGLPWNVDICLMAILFFYVGYLVKNAKAVDFLSKTKVRWILAFLGCAALNVGVWYLNRELGGSGLEMFDANYRFLPLTYLAAFFGIGATVLFSKAIKSKYLRYIGQNSLVYFAWHQTIAIPLSIQILKWSGYEALQISSDWRGLIQFCMALAICTLLNLLFTKTKLRVCLGKF